MRLFTTVYCSGRIKFHWILQNYRSIEIYFLFAFDERRLNREVDVIDPPATAVFREKSPNILFSLQQQIHGNNVVTSAALSLWWLTIAPANWRDNSSWKFTRSPSHCPYKTPASAFKNLACQDNHTPQQLTISQIIQVFLTGYQN